MKLVLPILLIFFTASSAISQEIDPAEAEAFWASTITPFLDNDKEAVMELTNFPIKTYMGDRAEEEFLVEYEEFFTEDVIYQLANASAGEIQPVEYDEGELTYMLVLISTYLIEDEGGEMDGEEMESATVLSFKKFDGVWKLYSIDIAG